MIAVGYPVRRFKLLAFAVAGGIAGALFAQLNGYISPGAFYWTTSGEVLLMCIIGGQGSLLGPLLGAADAIHTYYGESHILHGVSVRVGAGETVALLGRNGVGKTTLIRSIVGFTPPREGRIVFAGEAIQGWPAYRIARRGLALVPRCTS